MPNASRAYGGPTQSLVGYAQAARAAGLAVAVAAPEPPPEDAAWLREQLPGASFHFFRGLGRSAFSVAPGLLMWLARAGRRFDVVHVHGLFNPTSSLAARIRLWQGRPLVIRPFGTLSRYTFAHRRTGLKRLYLRLIDGPTLRRTHAVQFTTNAERREAARLRLHQDARSHVVPPPYRPTRAPGGGASPPEASKARRPTLLFLSRLHPVKNVESLLRAWPRVADALPDARLVLAGDGEPAYVATLKEQAAPLDAVSFAGFVTGDEKERLLRAAHAFVLPSHHESFGVAVLEALAAGLPIVITPEVQLASFVAEHGLGQVVPPEPEALAAALTAALTDAALQARCRAQAPALVEDHFSPAAVGQKLRAMYEAAAV